MQLKYKILGLIVLILAVCWQYEQMTQDEVIVQEIKKLNEESDADIVLINEKKLDKIITDKNKHILSNNEKHQEQREQEYILNEKSLNIDNLTETYKDFCIKDFANKPTDQLNQKEKLEAFIKGPCAPAVMVPGIMGTTLQILIDCEKLLKEEPEIFASCGWNTCSSWRIFSSKPKSEYTIWIGGLNNPGSVFSFGKLGSEKSKCFGHLLSLRRTQNPSSDYDMYESPKGLTVTFKGNTASTRQDSRCGNTGIEDLFSMQHLQFVECAFKGFRNMINLLDSMGYQPGITYQSLPYDFREGVWQVPTENQIKKSLVNLKKYTGKKTNLITHSYGSLHAHYALAKFDQEFKDNYINTWIPTGAPFSGAPQILKNHINCNDNFIDTVFSFMGRSLQVGMRFGSQKILTESSASLFDLYPKDVQERHKDAPWMKEILKRAEYEKLTLDQKKQYKGKEIPLNYFPTTDKICKPTVEGEHKYCQTYLYDMLEEPIMKIADDKYYLKTEDLKDMLEKYSVLEGTMETFEENWQETFLNLTNPGVKVANVYGAFGIVNTSYQYKEDPRPYTERGEYYFPDVLTSTFGDMTVSTNSALTGPIKWLWQHQNESQNVNNKPVKMIELCSRYNQTVDFNDYQDSKSGEKTFTQSGYNGLECKCFYTENYGDCEHSCMINDPYYLQMIANISMNNEVSEYKQKLPEFLEKLDHFDITEIMMECPNLYELNN